MVVHTARALSHRLDRLEPSQRLVRSRKQRSDLHQPRTNVKKSLTFAERTIRKTVWDTTRSNMKADLQAARDEIRSLAGLLAGKYGHAVDHWYDRIMQTARLAKNGRRTSRWNAYMSLRLRQINLALSAGAPKKKANDREALDLIREEWAVLQTIL
ncbi:hypothetical protein QCA50_013627 [Cerrena zonata]|uniref:CHAD domain-containing protein n=1 Tax=Cerrena zonata TaxID=2478898 RepID=A0AAW0G2T9_9APHY